MALFFTVKGKGTKGGGGYVCPVTKQDGQFCLATDDEFQFSDDSVCVCVATAMMNTGKGVRYDVTVKDPTPNQDKIEGLPGNMYPKTTAEDMKV